MYATEILEVRSRFGLCINIGTVNSATVSVLRLHHFYWSRRVNVRITPEATDEKNQFDKNVYVQPTNGGD